MAIKLPWNLVPLPTGTGAQDNASKREKSHVTFKDSFTLL